METLERAPWIPYLTINEETGERQIKEDTPEEIKIKYNEYLNNIEHKKQNSELIIK